MKSRLKNSRDIKKLEVAFLLTVVLGATSCGSTAVTNQETAVFEDSEDIETLHSGDIDEEVEAMEVEVVDESLYNKLDMTLGTAQEIITDGLTRLFNNDDGVTVAVFINEITEESYDYSIGIDKDRTIIFDNNTNEVYVDTGNSDVDLYCYNEESGWTKYIGHSVIDQTIDDIWDTRMMQTIGCWRDKDLEETAQYYSEYAVLGEEHEVLGLNYYTVDVYTASEILVERYFINKETMELEIVDEFGKTTENVNTSAEKADIYYMLQYTESSDISQFKSDVLDTENYTINDLTKTEQ